MVCKNPKLGTNGTNYLIRKDNDYLAQNEEKEEKIRSGEVEQYS